MPARPTFLAGVGFPGRPKGNAHHQGGPDDDENDSSTLAFVSAGPQICMALAGTCLSAPVT